MTILVWSLVAAGFTGLDLYANYDHDAKLRTFTSMVRNWSKGSATRKGIILLLLVDLASHLILGTSLIPGIGSS